MDNIAVIILFLFLGIVIGVFLFWIINKLKEKNTQNNANKLLEDAKKEALKKRRNELDNEIIEFRKVA